MSGGTFDINRFSLYDVMETIQEACKKAKNFGFYKKETIKKLLDIALDIGLTANKLHFADYLMAGDYGEDDLEDRLAKKLEQAKNAITLENEEILNTPPNPNSFYKLEEPFQKVAHYSTDEYHYNILCRKNVEYATCRIDNQKDGIVNCPECLKKAQEIVDSWDKQ